MNDRDTSGHFVQKSGGGGKLKQDREKARPSDRLRHDEAPPPGDNAAAPNGEPAADSGGDAPGSGAASDSGPRAPARWKKPRPDRPAGTVPIGGAWSAWEPVSAT